jgi:hypothetical protein
MVLLTLSTVASASCGGYDSTATPVVFVLYQWLCKHCRFLLLISESRGLPRSYFVMLDRTSLFKLPSGNALSSSANGTPAIFLRTLLRLVPHFVSYRWLRKHCRLLICCSHGWPQWHCPLPVHCRCADGHIDTVGRLLMPWTSNLISQCVALTDGHNGTIRILSASCSGGGYNSASTPVVHSYRWSIDTFGSLSSSCRWSP